MMSASSALRCSSGSEGLCKVFPEHFREEPNLAPIWSIARFKKDP